MTRKKLLIVTDSFLPRIDGVARFLDDIIHHLQKVFDLTVIAPHFKGDFSLSYPLNLIRMPVYPFRVADYHFPRRDSKIIEKHVLLNDLVWTQTLGPLGATAIIKGFKHNRKIISYVHSVEWELFSKGFSKSQYIYKSIEPLAKRYTRKLYNKCSRLLIPSIDIKEKLEKNNIHVPMTLVHMGIDVKKFHPIEDIKISKESLGIHSSSYVIGFVGRLAKEKDLGTLVSAFNRLSIKDKKLLIVGEGAPSIKSLFTSRDMINVGAVSDVSHYLHAMDVFVMPSLTETSSLSTMEAMASGVPVVCTPVGNIKHYIKDRVNGLLFHPRNDETLSELLDELYRDNTLRKRLAISGRETIVSEYLWINTVEKIINVLGFHPDNNPPSLNP
jgi:glycosyltransferase involved in cell wall biosynthesis